MSEQYKYPAQSPQPAQPPVRPKRARVWPWIAGIVATAVVCGIAGAVVGGALVIATTPEPAAVETPEPVIRTEYLPGDTVTPPECIEALDVLGEVLVLQYELQDVTTEALRGAVQQDSSAIPRLTRETSELNDQINAATGSLGDSVTVCRTSAR